jgi:hypothetical protein
MDFPLLGDFCVQSGIEKLGYTLSRIVVSLLDRRVRTSGIRLLSATSVATHHQSCLVDGLLPNFCRGAGAASMQLLDAPDRGTTVPANIHVSVRDEPNHDRSEYRTQAR